MKNIFLFIVITVLLYNNLSAQNINTQLTDNKGNSYLLGEIDLTGLQSENYNHWFSKNFEDYKPDSKVINTIKTKLKHYDLTLFLGTWCGDSKQEVPRLLKVLKACNYPMHKLKMVALSREKGMYKQSPQHEEAGLNIHRVPTLIVFKNEKEVNRIVEHPIDNFEKDLANIITKNNYKSNYQIVTKINNILDKKGIKGFKKQQPKLLKVYKNIVKSMYSLNTYSYILMGQNKINEAIEVLKFNTKLFKNKPKTFQYLANAYIHKGETDAKATIEKALKIHPKDTTLNAYLHELK